VVIRFFTNDIFTDILTPFPNMSEPHTPESASPSVKFDDSKVCATYANFCCVRGTPEELIIDFGLNPQPVTVGENVPSITVTNRIVTSYYTAKRMLLAVQTAILRHEQMFGILEIDVQKRVKQ
jgi:hypothetical protein